MSGRPPPTDFASALMLRVLAEGMRQQGLTPPKGLAPPPGGEAWVRLLNKRALVGSAVAQGGLAVLPTLGRGLAAMAGDPMHRALVQARSVSELLQRWMRLERYIHSRHRLVILHIAEGERGGEARLAHTAPSGPPPMAAEDLVVLGVLAALLEALGLQAVQAWAGDVPVLPAADAAGLPEAASAGRTAQWRLRWQGPVTGRLETALPDTGAAGRAAARVSGSGHVLPTPVCPPHDRPAANTPPATWPEAVQRAADALARDLAQPPGLERLASALGRSPRSLQRDLQQAGLTLGRLQAQLRAQAASAWLLNSARPVAEIGYLCGYSDQAHFSRDFRRRVGLPPAAFRESFAGQR